MLETISDPDYDLIERMKGDVVEVGEELTARRIIRHYEIEVFPGIDQMSQEIHAVFYNPRHDRSVSVWISNFFSAQNESPFGCRAQLWGKASSSRPDAHHSVRLSDHLVVPVCADSISCAVSDLITLKV